MHTMSVRLVFCSLFAFALGLSGCGGSGVEEITESRPLIAPKAAPPANTTSAERLGMTSGPAMTQSPASTSFTWDTPEGWTEEPATQMRQINLRPAGDPKAECYLNLGSGGGLAANINRWRGQMGLEPIDEAAIAALPKKPLLGTEAIYLDLDGTYGGMGGDQQNADFKMIGLISDVAGTPVFVKMTGPKALIEQELPKFEAFVTSISMGDQVNPHVHTDAAGAGAEGLPAGHPPIDPGMTATSPAPTTSSLTWTAPAGWTQGGFRQMREVTFTMGPDGKTECYITKLSNMGGGVEANINRWAGQMGQPALTPEQIEALPKINVLGKPGPMVELKGNYTDMSGNAFPDYTMLGAIGELGTSGIFVKLTGPAAEVEAEKANFVAFCESLK